MLVIAFLLTLDFHSNYLLQTTFDVCAKSIEAWKQAKKGAYLSNE